MVFSLAGSGFTPFHGGGVLIGKTLVVFTMPAGYQFNKFGDQSYSHLSFKLLYRKGVTVRPNRPLTSPVFRDFHPDYF